MPDSYPSNPPALSSLLREKLEELVRRHQQHAAPEPVLAALCDLALQLFDVSLVSITLGDMGEQQWLLQRSDDEEGVAAALRLGLFNQLTHGQPLLLPDLREVPDLRHLPEIASDYGLRFYAGVPIFLHRELPIGVLNLHGYQVHELSDAALRRLDLMAQLASLELSRQLDDEYLQERIDLLEQSQESSRVGSWSINLLTGRVQWSRQTYRLLDVAVDVEPNSRLIGSFWTDSPDETGRRSMDALIERGEAFDETWDMRTASGRICRMRVVARAEQADGEIRSVIGTIQDVSSTSR